VACSHYTVHLTPLALADRGSSAGKKLAVLPLHHKLAIDFRHWIGDRTGPIFPGLAKKRTRKMIKLDQAEAEIPHKTARGDRCFHSLRNTFVSSLFDARAGVAQVKRLARHSDVSLMMKYAKPTTTEGRIVDALAYPPDLVQEATERAQTAREAVEKVPPIGLEPITL
jgi:hypothetical protein